jgi:glyoxylase-like metal-dependent hydrolase (beta-lactamase superfamily II)
MSTDNRTRSPHRRPSTPLESLKMNDKEAEYYASAFTHAQIDTLAGETKDSFIGWTRFRHGDFQCTVVTDGPLRMGPPADAFPKADQKEIAELLTAAFLPAESITLNQNLLIVNTGESLVLFDTGCGANQSFGKSSFGPDIGRAIWNIRAAGINPDDIGLVAITHAHPDHCWGLVDDNGNRFYPNAKIAISATEYDYWTDLTHIPEAPTQQKKDFFRGAGYNLLPYRDRLIFVEDGKLVVPGITAHAATGHSPGHYIYAIESRGETLIVIGDLSHHQVLSLKRPRWEFKFDDDSAKAAETRIRLFDQIVQEKHAILAYHFPFPGLGHLRKDADGYTWVATVENSLLIKQV